MGETRRVTGVRRGKRPEALDSVSPAKTLSGPPASPVDLGASTPSPQSDPMQAGRFGQFATWLKRKLR